VFLPVPALSTSFFFLFSAGWGGKWLAHNQTRALIPALSRLLNRFFIPLKSFSVQGLKHPTLTGCPMAL
jgi:hypothetical protein